MKKVNKFLSMLLCFVMILGLLPAAAVPVQAANSDPYIGVRVIGNGYTKQSSGYELNITEEKLIKEGSGTFSTSGYSALCTDANCETKLDDDPRVGRTYYFRIYFAYYSDRTYAITDANSTIEIGGFSNGKLVSFQRNGGYLEVVCSVKYGEEISHVNAVGTGYGYDSDQGGYAPIFSTLEAYTSDGKKVEQEDFVWHYTFYTSASFNSSVKLTTEPVNGETYYFAIYVDMYDDGILYDYGLDSIIENSTVTIPGFEVEYYRFMEREMGSYMEIAYSATKRDPEVWVGGVGMYDGDYLAVGATETTETQPSGGYASLTNLFSI